MTDMLDRREIRHRRTREDILEAAWDLAERDGIASLSLRNLAARVGMRAPSLYTYFAGKDEIYDAMFAQAYHELDELDAFIAEETIGMTHFDALVHEVERFLAFCQESIPRYQLMFTKVIPAWEPSPEAYAVSQATFAREVETLASYGIEGERAVDLFTALNAGLAAQQIANDPDGDRWVRLVPEAIEMFLAHHDKEGAS
jgi:AcrR family transcriptional regulator